MGTYLQRYNTHDEYSNQNIISKYNVNVSNDIEHVHYNYVPIYSTKKFTIEILEDETTITFRNISTGELNYSKYVDKNTDISYDTKHLTFEDNGSWYLILITGDAGHIIEIYGTLQTTTDSGIGTITSDKNINVYGNPLSLLYGDTFNNVNLNNSNLLPSHAFHSLFNQNTHLISAKNLVLTPHIASSYCYYYMFYNCTNLIDAPILQLTTLADHCCSYMFSGCTSLINVQSILGATTLAQYCYASMFYQCTSLKKIPELPATTLAANCYRSMFNSCVSLTHAQQLPAMIMVNQCYYSMFAGCTSLQNAPDLPATTLANECYASMFNKCTSLTKAQDVLPASSITSYAYKAMYAYTNIIQPPTILATTVGTGGCQQMFAYCTSMTYAPNLSHITTLTTYCYENMFRYCTSLTKAPDLPAMGVKADCYRYMFNSCLNLVDAPSILPATTLANYCYYYMFKHCVKLTNAPILPATSITQTGVYNAMFYACSQLQQVKAMMLSIPGSQTSNWLYNVPNNSSCTFTYHPDADWVTQSGATYIPSNWTRIPEELNVFTTT